MEHFEQNQWSMTEKQKRAKGILPMTEKQRLAHEQNETAESKEYNFSAAESIFGGVDDESAPSTQNEPTKH